MQLLLVCLTLLPFRGAGQLDPFAVVGVLQTVYSTASDENVRAAAQFLRSSAVHLSVFGFPMSEVARCALAPAADALEQAASSGWLAKAGVDEGRLLQDVNIKLDRVLDAERALTFMTKQIAVKVDDLWQNMKFKLADLDTVDSKYEALVRLLSDAASDPGVLVDARRYAITASEDLAGISYAHQALSAANIEAYLDYISAHQHGGFVDVSVTAVAWYQAVATRVKLFTIFWQGQVLEHHRVTATAARFARDLRDDLAAYNATAWRLGLPSASQEQLANNTMGCRSVWNLKQFLEEHSLNTSEVARLERCCCTLQCEISGSMGCPYAGEQLQKGALCRPIRPIADLGLQRATIRRALEWDPNLPAEALHAYATDRENATATFHVEAWPVISFGVGPRGPLRPVGHLWSAAWSCSRPLRLSRPGSSSIKRVRQSLWGGDAAVGAEADGDLVGHVSPVLQPGLVPLLRARKTWERVLTSFLPPFAALLSVQDTLLTTDRGAAEAFGRPEVLGYVVAAEADPPSGLGATSAVPPGRTAAAALAAAALATSAAAALAAAWGRRRRLADSGPAEPLL